MNKNYQNLTSVETIYTPKLKTVRLKLNPLHVCDLSKPFVTAPLDVEPVLRSIYVDLEPDQEHFVLIALNTSSRIIGYKLLFTGGQTMAIVDPKIVFRNALFLGAVSIIVAHNHPSGNTAISREDRSITDALVEAGKVLQIPVLDHMILTHETMVSLAQAGIC